MQFNILYTAADTYGQVHRIGPFDSREAAEQAASAAQARGEFDVDDQHVYLIGDDVFIELSGDDLASHDGIKTIRFVEDIELCVVTEFDESRDRITSSHNRRPVHCNVAVAEIRRQVFRAGEEVEVDVTSSGPFLVDIQFGDGSIVLGLNRQTFLILE